MLSRHFSAGLSNRQAFTLIEMLIVIVILGILAMIIIPQISVSTEDAKLSTLQTDLNALRSAIEIYYTQHNSVYPGDSVPTNAPADVTSQPLAFVAQLTRYTAVDGRISNTKTDEFKYGPYVKGNSLPTNPFNDKNDVTIDSTVVDITTRSSAGAGTGWKFYSKTGVFMAGDGAHDNL